MGTKRFVLSHDHFQIPRINPSAYKFVATRNGFSLARASLFHSFFYVVLQVHRSLTKKNGERTLCSWTAAVSGIHEMFYWLLLPIFLSLRFSTLSAVPSECRELLTCSVKSGCVNLKWLSSKMENANVSAQMYNDLDTAIDYSCIFTLGCPKECTACQLCHTSKIQVIEVLAGKARKTEKCPELISCATDCVAKSTTNMSNINHCIRRKCAFYCFNGSCPKCAAFITK
ncbi:hypothetical protein GCK32_009526, partial [Trichostrongylus colubriformis]